MYMSRFVGRSSFGRQRTFVNTSHMKHKAFTENETGIYRRYEIQSAGE